jgi:RNA polymerase sigma factor for flagellar operon FliA
MGMETAGMAGNQGSQRRGGGGYPPAAGAVPVLSGEQERVLLEHLPIVRFLARRIHERLPQHVDIEDLVSAGVVGLMDAFAKFDPTKKVQFRSYAQFRIRGAILDSLRTLDWSPRELRRKGRAVEEAIRVLTSRMGHAPGEADVAVEMGLGLEEYQQLLGDLKGLEIGTLHMERNEDSGDEELAYVPGRPEDDPLFRCLRGDAERRRLYRHAQVRLRCCWARTRVQPTMSGWMVRPPLSAALQRFADRERLRSERRARWRREVCGAVPSPSEFRWECDRPRQRPPGSGPGVHGAFLRSQCVGNRADRKSRLGRRRDRREPQPRFARR